MENFIFCEVKLLQFYHYMHANILNRSHVDFQSIYHSVKVSKYEVFSDPYFTVFELNTGQYGPEKTLYLDTFHAVR